MKKYLLVTLAFLFIFATVLTSCNIPEDTSKAPSDVSEPKSNVPSETESNIPSDTPSQDELTSLPEEDILKDKKILYYFGEHYAYRQNDLKPHGIKEVYSNLSSVMRYIDNNSIASDTYFLVGLDIRISGGLVNRLELGKIFSDIGIVLDKNHPMRYDSNVPMPELTFSDAPDKDPVLEQREDDIKRWKKILPDFDDSRYTNDQLSLLPEFQYVGYITAEGLKKLDSYKDYSIYLTWLNSPDNYEVWENSIHH